MTIIIYTRRKSESSRTLKRRGMYAAKRCRVFSFYAAHVEIYTYYIYMLLYTRTPWKFTAPHLSVWTCVRIYMCTYSNADVIRCKYLCATPEESKWLSSFFFFFCSREWPFIYMGLFWIPNNQFARVCFSPSAELQLEYTPNKKYKERKTNTRYAFASSFR